jgi:hypothetical protein
MKIETEQQRKEFLQEVIDRILYLPSDEKEKFVSVMVSSFRKFTPMYRIEQGETRVYQKVKN